MATYFLYRHIRLDLNVPFYIGIGKINSRPRRDTFKEIYRRAYSKQDKSALWNEIINKASYDVEIIFETEDKELIERKENEFIVLYGRQFDNSGTLVNVNDGGFKCKGVKRVSRLKLAKKVFVYKCTGEFVGKYEIGREAMRELGITVSISTAIRKYKGFSSGYLFFYEYQGLHTTPYKPIQKRIGEKVYVKNQRLNFEKIYNSKLQASKDLKIPYGTLQSRISNGVPLHGYYFKTIQ